MLGLGFQLIITCFCDIPKRNTLYQMNQKAKEKLKELSVEELKKKEKSHKMLIAVFIPLIIGLFYAVFRDYSNGEEIDWSILTIAICTLGGPATLYPELKEVQKEIKTRG